VSQDFLLPTFWHIHKIFQNTWISSAIFSSASVLTLAHSRDERV